jgi:acetyl esterase/lipase
VNRTALQFTIKLWSVSPLFAKGVSIAAVANNSVVPMSKSSVRSRLLEWALWRLHMKKRMGGLEGLRAQVIKSRPANAQPPRSMYTRFEINETEGAGCRVFTLSRRAGQQSKHILYFHGGAYVYEIMGLLWKMIGRLLEEVDVSVIVPLYLLVPEHQCSQVLPFALRAEFLDPTPRDYGHGHLVLEKQCGLLDACEAGWVRW